MHPVSRQQVLKAHSNEVIASVTPRKLSVYVAKPAGWRQRGQSVGSRTVDGVSLGRKAVVVRADGEPNTKSLEGMRKFSEQYARRTQTYFCSDLSVTAVVIKGLAEHKDQLGAPLCPCRHYDDKKAEAEQGFWNCPCVPMRERKECHCMLFLTEDNGFRGEGQKIALDEIQEATKGMSGVQP